MPSNHFILDSPLLLLPSIFPSIRVFSNESVLCIRRPKYWSFSFSIHPSSEYSGLIFSAWCTVNSKQDAASVLVIINSPAMNTGVNVSLWIMVFSEDMPRQGKKGKVGWTGRLGLTDIHCHEWNRQLVGPYCIAEGARLRAPWWPRGVGWWGWGPKRVMTYVHIYWFTFYTVETNTTLQSNYVVVQSPSRVRLFAALWTEARQASLSITISPSLLRLVSVVLILPPNHLTLCWPFSYCTQFFPVSGKLLYSN